MMNFAAQMPMIKTGMRHSATSILVYTTGNTALRTKVKTSVTPISPSRPPVKAEWLS